jgi:hypothetical protein
MTEMVNGKEIAVEMISQDEVKDVFNRIRNGQIFSCIFIKKDGNERLMNCRRGVKKGLTGGGHGYNPEEYGLMSVFDMQKKEYRMLNYKTTTEIRANKKRYMVKTD